MAHFAQLDENNTVISVIVVHNNELLDKNGIEQESKGQEFCNSLFGGIWKQTSYNATFRKHYTGFGYIYDEDLDAFISPKPYDSWVLDVDSCLWESPTPKPNDDKIYRWDEPTLAWIEII